MARVTPRKDMTLKALELFQLCARKGSLQDAAAETGLSISTVSHHLRNLEDHLGVALFNHNRRPMVLTPKGHSFLRNIDTALRAIRKAKSEAMAGSAPETRHLRTGCIEDFDSDIMPELAVYLSDRMPECDFLYHTGTSHEIIGMLRNRHLDLGISTSPQEHLPDVIDRPLFRDPFVIALPRSTQGSLSDVIDGKTNLPFLQFSSDLIIAQQIEAQLRRLGLSLPHRFACGNNQTLMAMVASGAGWTITTPLLFSRARRFQPKVLIHPFPGKGFARRLSLLSTTDCSHSVFDLVDRKLRALIDAHIVTPVHGRHAWLRDQFGLIT